MLVTALPVATLLQTPRASLSLLYHSIPAPMGPLLCAVPIFPQTGGRAIRGAGGGHLATPVLYVRLVSRRETKKGWSDCSSLLLFRRDRGPPRGPACVRTKSVIILVPKIFIFTIGFSARGAVIRETVGLRESAGGNHTAEQVSFGIIGGEKRHCPFRHASVHGFRRGPSGFRILPLGRPVGGAALAFLAGGAAWDCSPAFAFPLPEGAGAHRLIDSHAID